MPISFFQTQIFPSYNHFNDFDNNSSAYFTNETKKEVNEIIMQYHEDFCTIRRDMISEHIMEREGSTYKLK